MSVTVIPTPAGVSWIELRCRLGVLVADGADADALLLDLDALRDTATYQNGNALTAGIKRIFIGGREIALPNA